ncbi:MAG: arginine ABC transporter permease ArtQ, partial [Serpentinimonas sp.]|nr:arginine ABC transporter permease ArtQ [Serpentinimonas sp.]
ALVSLIGLHDVTFHAMQAGAATREPFYFLLLAAAVFLAYTSVSLWALRALSRRYALGSTQVSL